MKLNWLTYDAGYTCLCVIVLQKSYRYNLV